MNVLIVSPTLNIPLAPDHGLSVDLEYGSALPLDPELECPRNSLIIVRSEHRDIVLIMRDGNGSLIVNGHKVYGFCSVHANAVVRVHVGNHVQSFAVIFDDAVVDIPAGSVCDICGKNLQEVIRHALLTNCSGEVIRCFLEDRGLTNEEVNPLCDDFAGRSDHVKFRRGETDAV